MAEGGFRIREETRKRCKIMAIDKTLQDKFVPVSLELFHFLYQVKTIQFPIYFRVRDMLVEFIKPEEFSKELLDEMWEAMQRPVEGLDVCIMKRDRVPFESTIDGVRNQKLKILNEKFPGLDQKTLDLYGNLSGASQLIVHGGIDAQVVDKVKSAAAFMVSNIMDSDAAISTLSRMITCDPTLYDHSASVAMFASVISSKILPKPLSQKESEILAQCALYHDVGKTCVPSAVLNKPGKFTPAEFEIMKSHTSKGYEELQRVIAKGAHIDSLAARVAHEHHEKLDGCGYPNGKKGMHEHDHENGIHIYTRIVTIADIYSALLMKRIYKPAYEPQDAIKIMVQEAKGLDPVIFPRFLKSVVKSLNYQQESSKGGRFLTIGEDGSVSEWKHPSTKDRAAS